MRRLRIPAFAAALLVVAAQAPAQVPPGYKTYENKLAELTFIYPVAFEEMPLPPTEQSLVARYLLKTKPADWKKLDDRVFEAVRPEIVVFRFEQDAAATGPKPTAGEDPKKPANVREAMESASRVTTWDQFEKRLRAWELTPDPQRQGNFTMKARQTVPNLPPRIGYLVRKQDGAVVFGVFGVSIQGEEKDLAAQIQRIGASLRLAAEGAGDNAEAAIDRLYASGKYRDVEGRKKARSELAAGWKALDTEHYLIVHHSKSLGLIQRIARDIEAMRALYAEQFPPKRPVEKLSIVRICRTNDEYHQYGGPPNTGGFWHPGNEELVLYDYSYTMKTLDDDERKRLDKAKVQLSDDDSLLVLYHEAFHQYIHYAVGEFAPHDWFNEGYGDFFSGAVVGDSTGKVLRIDPSPWRIHVAKDMCEYGKGFIPLKEILEAERAVFYNPARAGLFYAGAWSFVFFLKNSKEAQGNPQWSRLLTTYFETAKAAYDRELAKAGGAPNLEQKTIAGFAARKAALQQALQGIDLAALEAAWRKWVVEMKDPWPSKRAKPPKK